MKRYSMNFAKDRPHYIRKNTYYSYSMPVRGGRRQTVGYHCIARKLSPYKDETMYIYNRRYVGGVAH